MAALRDRRVGGSSRILEPDDPDLPDRMHLKLGHVRGRCLAAGVGIVVALVAWVALLYGVSWHVLGGSSDNAAPLLAGRDMLHGNVFLHGWSLTTDSYWLLDLPLLGLYATTLGLGPAAFHVVPTAIAAVTVLLATACATIGANRRDALVAGGTTFCIIGLPSAVLAAYLLQGPVHVMTTLVCLLAFALLTPGHRRARWWSGNLLLLIAVASDPFAVAIGTLPVIVAGVALIRTRQFRDGRRLVLAAGAATVAGEILVRAVNALGGFRRLRPLPLAAPSQWAPNLRLAAHDFLYTLGVRVLPSWPRVAWLERLAHIAGAVLMGAGVALAITNLLRRLVVGRGPGTWIDDVCALGFLGSVSFYVMVVSPGENISRTRYLVPAMVFGAILAGRLAGWLVRVVVAHAAAQTIPGWTRHAVRGGAIGAALLVAVAYVAATTSFARTRNPPNPAIALSSWLSAHDLTEGWGGYWDATVTTVASGDRVHVQPVVAVRGRLQGHRYFASDTWFSAKRSRSPSTFLIYRPRAPWGGVNLASATATFGRPIEREHVGRFEVLIWDHDTTTQLRRSTSRHQALRRNTRQPDSVGVAGANEDVLK